MAQDLKQRFEAARRYKDVWNAATAFDDESPVTAEIVEPGGRGSLRPEITQLSATIGDTVISITNGRAVFGEAEAVDADLTALEEVITAPAE